MARQKLRQFDFKGVDLCVLNGLDLSFINKHLKALREDSMEQLEKLVKHNQKAYKQRPNYQSTLILACSVIEMLARTCCQDGNKAQECNTVQVLTILMMLRSHDSTLINQIDTGEGKSRIMMVLAACKALMGNTVDFVTSNEVLAQRDYFTYMNFFKALGIKVGLVSTTMTPESYVKGGINFADTNSIFLRRGLAKIQEHESIDDFLDKDKHVLLGDEFDQLFYDRMDAFNVSSKLEIDGLSFQDLESFYRLMWEGCDLPEEIISKQSQDEDFNKWVQERQISCENVDNEYQLNVHYAISESEAIAVDGSVIYGKRIQVLQDGRVRPNCTFSKGVQQFLYFKHKEGYPDLVYEPEQSVVQTQRVPSHIEPYSQRIGVTGTARFDEAWFNDAAKIKTPRLKQSGLKDHGMTYVSTLDKKHAWIMAQIKKVQSNSQHPILIHCADDRASEELNDYLSKNRLADSLLRLHAGMSLEEESESLTMAGRANQIILASAGMAGRGTDIKVTLDINYKSLLHAHYLLQNIVSVKVEQPEVGKKVMFGQLLQGPN